MNITQRIHQFNRANEPMHIVDHENGEYSLCLPLDFLTEPYRDFGQEAFNQYAEQNGDPVKVNGLYTHGSGYAAQLLHSIKNNRNWFAAMSTLRLLHHMSQMIRNRLEDERKGKSGAIIDRKLRRKIQEKNEALGIKQG